MRRGALEFSNLTRLVKTLLTKALKECDSDFETINQMTKALKECDSDFETINQIYKHYLQDWKYYKTY
jgi:hypothetical protein